MSARLTPQQERLLSRALRARKTAAGLRLRCAIVLAVSAGKSDADAARELRVAHATVAKWRRRFAAAGLHGLLDAPRCGRPAHTQATERLRSVLVACAAAETDTTQAHPSVRAIAAQTGIAKSSVHRMLHAFGLSRRRKRR